jgi:hypothetical protein
MLNLDYTGTELYYSGWEAQVVREKSAHAATAATNYDNREG